MSVAVADAATLAETDRLGAALAAVLPPKLTIALLGTLGAGKTRFVQALAAACEIPRETVVSPTFVLCQRYCGTRTIYHWDAYRLHDEDEFLQLGPEETFDAVAITIIEWADRVVACLPPDHLEIEIAITGAESRRFFVRSRGPQSEQVVTALQARLAEDTT